MSTSDLAERPTGAELLEIARATLLRDVVPALQGDARFKALMVANAMAIALRETLADRQVLERPVELLKDLIKGDMWELCRQIRDGRHDPESLTYHAVGALLAAIAEARCRISAPKALGLAG